MLNFNDIINSSKETYIIIDGIGIYLRNGKITLIDIFPSEDISIILFHRAKSSTTLEIKTDKDVPEWFINYVVNNRQKILNLKIHKFEIYDDEIIINDIYFEKDDVINTKDPFKALKEYIDSQVQNDSM